MKLRYHIDPKTSEKIYTLKNKINGIETKPAHYKFLKLRDVNEKKESKPEL